MEITVGMKGEASTQVERADTALEVGSGDLLVFATPCMAALMEARPAKPLPRPFPRDRPPWEPRSSLVHTSATPVGLEVRAEAEVTGVAGKVITFQVTAFDESGEIGRGTHQRVLVHAQRFLEKAYEKI